MNPVEGLRMCFQSDSPVWERFLERFSRTAQAVSWYPSAGLDLRPFVFQTRTGLKDSLPQLDLNYFGPDLWLFSDCGAGIDRWSVESYWLRTFFKDPQPMNLFTDGRTEINVMECCIIRPVWTNYKFEINPNNVLCTGDITGKSVFFRAIIKCHISGVFEVDAIYFGYDNINLANQSNTTGKAGGLR